MPEVKPKEEIKDHVCNHNWNDPESYEYVTTLVSGVNRYYKQCPKCTAKSTLIKKREVELAMEAAGKTLDDVELIEG